LILQNKSSNLFILSDYTTGFLSNKEKVDQLAFFTPEPDYDTIYKISSQKVSNL
jgi:hypothetical protein